MDKKIYNTKRFLSQESHRTMSCYHAKVMSDGIMKVTIHDCKRSIQFRNDLNNPEEVTEAIEKLTNMASGLNSVIEFIKENYQEVSE
jgi:hypothetical protein